MFHKSSIWSLSGIILASLLIAMPVSAVQDFKVSDYGSGVQIWFEAEDFDERNPDNDTGFALTDEPDAFGRSITNTSGDDGAYMLRYVFDISAADGSGGTWYFWGRVINPHNRSSFMLVDGHPGDPVPSTLPVGGLSNGQRIFEENIGSTWTWARTNHAEAHTKTLRDGENIMYILSRETNGIMDVFMWTNDAGYVPTDDDYINALPGKPSGKALRPEPKDGAMVSATWVSATWRPGEFAVSHDVYLGESFDEVNEATVDSPTFQGNLTSNTFVAGFVTFPYPDGLTPGATYYWRVDAVNPADPNSPWKGDVWSFWIPPTNAYDPSPSDGAKFVAPDVTLDWAIGLNAILHTVYFGESFDDVNNATMGTSVVGTSFTPGTLELNKTYYWRVDEGTPPNPAVKGEVWSFTTTLPGLGTAVMDRWENIPTTDINALKNDPRFPNNPDVTETVDRFSWNGPDTDDYGARIEGWLYVPATGDYTFWLNTDDQGELWLSTDDDSSNAVLIARESSYTGFDVWNTGEEQSDPIPLVGGEKYYIMALWKEGGGGDHCQVAWRGPGIPTRTVIPGTNLSPYEPLSAFGASPANNAVGVTQTPVLLWKPGNKAASHEVYFGTDADAVANATKASPEFVGTRQLGAESYIPAALAWDATFYWRVDEVNAVEPDSPWIGKVWSFTTAEFGILEDFESYNDIEEGQPGSNLVYLTWADGFGVPTNGSTMGYAVPFQPTMESGTVHGGLQSAPMEYNNTGTASSSEVTRTLTPAQDWTANGIQTLSLWFYGNQANVPGQLYVKINGVQANYDGDAGNLTGGAWQVWNIDLTAIGTNLRNVTSLTIGVQGSGATGTLLLDDIRLYPYPRQLITPVEPDPAALLAHYTLDGNANDSAGTAHGTVVGGQFVPGRYGQAISLAGSAYVDCGNPSQLDFATGSWTVSAWVNAPSSTDQMNVFGKGGDNAGGIRYVLSVGETSDHVVVLTVDDNVTKVQSTGSVVVDDGQWHHIVGIRDQDGLSVYVDGFLDNGPVPLAATYNLSGTSQANAYIGAGWNYDTSVVQKFFTGSIDEVRVYNYALSDPEIRWLAGATSPFDAPF